MGSGGGAGGGAGAAGMPAAGGPPDPQEPRHRFKVRRETVTIDRNQRIAIAQCGGFFEFEILGGFLHLLFQLVNDLHDPVAAD